MTVVSLIRKGVSQVKGLSLPTLSVGTNPNELGAAVRKLAWAIAQWERQSGTRLEDSVLRERYAAMMPQLGETLGHARGIISAAQTVGRRRSGSSRLLDGDHEAVEENGPFSQVLPGYEILEAIDYGGQGLIYRAVQSATDKVVAVKMLLDGPLSSARQRQRFAREVGIISRLSHPNIVKLLDSGSLRGRQYFVMEYIEGLPIDDYFLLTPRTPQGLVTLFEKVCRAIASAHQHGIIHRDIKPSNIMVDSEAEPHVLDFGLAKELRPEFAPDSGPPISVAGQIVGTLPYLSPEQASGDADIDVRSDIYSLGVILYELVTGVLPYDTSGDPENVRRNIRLAEPYAFHEVRRLPQQNPLMSSIAISNDLERVILKALAKDKNHRYQSAVELADDLARFLRGEAVAAKADSSFYVLRKALRRYRAQVIVAAGFLALLIASVIGMGFLWIRAERQAKAFQKGLELGSYLHLANVSRDEGRVDEAIKMLQAAACLGVSEASLDDASLRFSFEVRYGLASLLLDRGQLDEAREQSTVARQLAEAKLSKNPNDLDWRRLLAEAYRVEGRVAIAGKDFEAAHVSLRRSSDVRRSLLEVEPDNPSLLAGSAATCQLEGRTCRLQGRHTEALEHYRQADEIYERLIKASPESSEYIVEQCMTKLSLAAWHIDQKTAEQDFVARELLTAILHRLEQLEKDHPKHGLDRDVGRLRDAVARDFKLIDNRDTVPAPPTDGSLQ